MEAHAEVHAHPLRSRSGMPPAVLHGVVDPNSLPFLREDLGDSQSSWKSQVPFDGDPMAGTAISFHDE
jgi:hypothetical protein